MCGYLSGLSAPSVTDMTTTRAASPRSNSAGQTRLPTFSTTTTEPGAGRERRERALQHRGVEMAACARVDLHHARAGRPDPLRVEQRLLITLDDGHGEFGTDVA